MAFEKKVEAEPKPEAKKTVRMKFTGPFKGTQKIVQLPIPLIANSQKLDEELLFVRASARQGPAYCDVPMEWVGALLDVGGRWQLVDPATPDLTTKIAEAKVVCDAKMQKFIADNELVEA